MERSTVLGIVIDALRKAGIQKESIEEDDQINETGLGMNVLDIAEFFRRLEKYGYYLTDGQQGRMKIVKDVVDFILADS